MKFRNIATLAIMLLACMLFSTSCVINDVQSKAFEQYRKAAEQGDAKAQYEFGRCYYIGYGVMQDRTEAVKLWRNAASHGCAKAQRMLGDCYYIGKGVEQNFAEAVKWYRKAAEQGDAKAQFELGICYYIGNGVEKNQAKAEEWYNKAAKQGDISFRVMLEYYRERQNYKIANTAELLELVKYAKCRKAAELGDATAQYELGICYYFGYGVEEDKVEAKRWHCKAAEQFRKAAEQGDTVAQYSLGICYFTGYGVEEDQAKAVQWYGKGKQFHMTKEGTPGMLGGRYNIGLHGFPIDDAIEWYFKAAEQGDANAQYSLGIFYEYGGYGVEMDEVEAIKWFRKSAKQNNAQAQFELGWCYATGSGVAKDEAEAIKWLRKSAKQNNVDAQFELGRCFATGYGVAKDNVEAKKWYRKAAEQGLPAAKAALEKLKQAVRRYGNSGFS